MKVFQNAHVKHIFDSFPDAHRKLLIEIRELIFTVAKNTEGVGPIVETLKWGEPTYITEKTRAGSSVRLYRFGSDNIGVFFNCQTSLVETFRNVFPHLEYAKNRAIVLDLEKPLPLTELYHCIQLSLTYKLQKQAARSGKNKRLRNMRTGKLK